MATQQGRIELELPCTLTDEEVQSRGRMLCETVWTIDEVSDARSSAMKAYKERLVGLNETQRKLARIIRERVEPRMVYCAVLFHVPCEGRKRIVRMDTGEQVREEDMTAAEKQLNLFAAQREFEQYMQEQRVEEIRETPREDEPPSRLADPG